VEEQGIYDIISTTYRYPMTQSSLLVLWWHTTPPPPLPQCRRNCTQPNNTRARNDIEGSGVRQSKSRGMRGVGLGRQEKGGCTHATYEQGSSRLSLQPFHEAPADGAGCACVWGGGGGRGSDEAVRGSVSTVVTDRVSILNLTLTAGAVIQVLEGAAVGSNEAGGLPGAGSTPVR
jgi:hypothetical protein